MAQLLPYPRFRAVDDGGNPLVGGLLYSYAPGTSTPKATYTDHTLGVANANPIELDENGEATVFIDGNTDFVLHDEDDALVWGPIRQLDPLKDATISNVTLSGTLTITSTAVTWSGNPTHSGNHTFGGSVQFDGDVTVGNGSTDALTLNPSEASIPNDLEFTDGELTFTPPTGTWSPGLSFGGGTTGITYSNNRLGLYWRIGGLCFFSLRLVITNKGSSTGAANITGLPVLPAGTAGLTQFPLSISALNMTGLTGSVYTSAIDGSALIPLLQSTSTSTESALTDAHFTNSSDIHVSGFFRV